MNLNLTISIDDVNPSPQYRLLGTPVEKWLQTLHDEFGVKFTLFCPSNYHGQWPISEHKGWINEINNDPKFEIACHGHYHQTTNPKLYGECEWLEIGAHESKYRFRDMSDEWDTAIGEFPKGWRNPGWLINENCQSYIDENFDYVALHYEHNRGLKWNCKTFFGHDGIQQENIKIHNISPDGETGMIMFQSHIAGKHNHNVWNEENYDQLRMSLTHLFENYDVTPKLLKECI